jgi:hypothetical protein
MTEDLVVLFLVTMLLVVTIAATTTGREYMTKTARPPPSDLSPEESLEIVENSLKKAGPSGTYAAFDTQLSKYEDLVAKDEKSEE